MAWRGFVHGLRGENPPTVSKNVLYVAYLFIVGGHNIEQISFGNSHFLSC